MTRFLYTLDELLALQTNGWSCADCGRTWGDLVGPSLAVVVTEGADPACRHPKLNRAYLAAA